MNVPTTAADIRDQHWLDQQVATLGDGIEAAREIWLNWSDLRCVGRLHPGQSAGEYIEGLGLRLTLTEAMAALPDGSNRQIATVAGVSEGTVRNNRGAQIYAPDEPPARVVGADGKSYPGRVVRVTTAEVIEPEQTAPLQMDILRQVLDLEDLIPNDPAAAAGAVSKSRVPATRAALKRFHAWLGTVIQELDKR